MLYATCTSFAVYVHLHSFAVYVHLQADILLVLYIYIFLEYWYSRYPGMVHKSQRHPPAGRATQAGEHNKKKKSKSPTGAKSTLRTAIIRYALIGAQNALFFSPFFFSSLAELSDGSLLFPQGVQEVVQSFAHGHLSETDHGCT